MDDLCQDIDNIGKGSQSIAKAFKEIQLVKEAFEKSGRIEYKINQNQQAISELKARMELLSTSAYVDFKTEKLQRMIDVLVKTKFDEYTSHLLIVIRLVTLKRRNCWSKRSIGPVLMNLKILMAPLNSNLTPLLKLILIIINLELKGT